MELLESKCVVFGYEDGRQERLPFGSILWSTAYHGRWL